MFRGIRRLLSCVRSTPTREYPSSVTCQQMVSCRRVRRVVENQKKWVSSLVVILGLVRIQKFNDSRVNSVDSSRWVVNEVMRTFDVRD